MKNIGIFLSENFPVLVVKLNRRVFVMNVLIFFLFLHENVCCGTH